MVKKRGLSYFVIFLLILSMMNLFFYYNKGTIRYGSLSGMFVTEIPTITSKFDISKILFFGQWLVIGIMVAVSIILGVKHMQEEKRTKVHYNEVREEKGKFGTDLDVFYKLLKKKKKLKINIISILFKISKDQALEWGKILENQNLAYIEYPVFGDPEIMIKETEEETLEKEKIKKEEKMRNAKEKK